MGVTWNDTKDDLDLNAVSKFIEENDAKFSGKLSGSYNYARVVSLAHFARLAEKLKIQNQEHVGVVSGSVNDPELKFVDPKKVSVLSFDVDPKYDLDEEWTEPPAEFSLTVCNQVLEHVFNPHVAMKNLVRCTAPGGLLYVSIPTINCIHGEPYFYSSGFHPRFLERLAKTNALEILDIGFWGSYKYMINTVGGVWLCEKDLRRGFRRRFDFVNPSLALKDGRIKNAQFITDCWALFRKA